MAVERVEEYMRKLGPIKGVNFVPSYCYGYIEIWHHYREDYILRELDYAVRIGINSVRIFVLCAQWQTHRDIVYANLDRFLDACKQRGISVMLCLQTGTVIPKGYVQKSDDPIIIKFRPGCHDQSWVFDGMYKDINNEYNQVSLDFVRDIVTRYGKDDRVAIWDLYNEAKSYPLITVQRPLFEHILSGLAYWLSEKGYSRHETLQIMQKRFPQYCIRANGLSIITDHDQRWETVNSE